MIRLTLATVGGERVSAAEPGPRWTEHGGSVVDRRRDDAALSLTDANAEFGRLSRTALAADRDGHPLRRVLAREALDLFCAIRSATRKHQSAGPTFFRRAYR